MQNQTQEGQFDCPSNHLSSSVKRVIPAISQSKQCLIDFLKDQLFAETIEPKDILDFVESATFDAVMHFSRGNQTSAAKVLGIARGTLRTKLQKHFGTTLVGGLYHQHCKTDPDSRNLQKQNSFNTTTGEK